MTKVLFKHKSKVKWYAENPKRRWEDLTKSNQYYLRKEFLNNKDILEVGCATGGLYEILKDKLDNFNYTGLDISPGDIKIARQRYKNARFVCGDLLTTKVGQYDVLICFNVLGHQKEYRKFLAKLTDVAKERVMVDLKLRYEGPTIVDLDTSYVYYHWSGKRQHDVVCNFYEIFNYLHIEMFNLKKISIYGYYPPQKTSAFMPMPKSKLITACMCLEKYPKVAKVGRFGGHAEFSSRNWCELDIHLPDFNMEDV